MKRVADLIDRMNDLIGRGVSWLALVMIIIGAWNAIARFVDRETGSAMSSNTWLESGWYLFAILFLFGAAWTLKSDRHVRVDIFYGKLSPRGKAWTDLLGVLLLLLPFTIFLLWNLTPSAIRSLSILEASPDPGGLPRWPLRSAAPVAIGLLLLQGISMGLRALVVIMEGEKREEKNISQSTSGI